MELAHLVLEYVRTLVWPAVLIVALMIFRKQIAGKLGDLRDATTPIGSASFFERTAGELPEAADQIAERQGEEERGLHDEDGPEEQAMDIFNLETVPDSLGLDFSAAFYRVTTRIAQARDFEMPLGLTSSAPVAAVMVAYAQLEKIGRDCWRLLFEGPPPPSPRRLLERLLIGDDDAAALVATLAQLRNQAAHDPEIRISAAAATDFVQTCAQMADVLIGVTRSKMRHPSEFPSVWERWRRKDPEAGPTRTRE